MNRRTFIKRTAVLLGLAFVAPKALIPSEVAVSAVKTVADGRYDGVQFILDESDAIPDGLYEGMRMQTGPAPYSVRFNSKGFGVVVANK